MKDTLKIANKINEFLINYDFYNYFDNKEETEQETIETIQSQLINDPEGVIEWLDTFECETIEEVQAICELYDLITPEESEAPIYGYDMQLDYYTRIYL